jgi:hypothetical protein
VKDGTKTLQIPYGVPVEVEWADACGISAAMSLKDASQHPTMLCRSMGWLLGCDKETLRLTPSVYDDQTCMDTLCVPMGWIKKINKI